MINAKQFIEIPTDLSPRVDVIGAVSLSKCKCAYGIKRVISLVDYPIACVP